MVLVDSIPLEVNVATPLVAKHLVNANVRDGLNLPLLQEKMLAPKRVHMKNDNGSPTTNPQ